MLFEFILGALVILLVFLVLLLRRVHARQKLLDEKLENIIKQNS